MHRLIWAVLVLSVSATATAGEYWQRAAELIRAQDYAAAHTEIQGLLAARPDDRLLLRLSGVTLIHTDRLDEAVAVLGRATEGDPDNVASWFYLGQALTYRGNLIEAISVLERVIAMAPESEYARLSRELLPDLRQLAATTDAISDKQRWNVYANVGLGWDDNVPARSDKDRDRSPTDSGRLVTSVYAEYRPWDQMVDPDQPFTVGAGLNYYGAWHQRDSLDDQDVTSGEVTLFLSRSGAWSSLPYQARLEGTYSRVDVGDEHLSDVYRIGAKLGLQWLDNGVGTVYYRYATTDFDDDTTRPDLNSRDGDEHVVGVLQQLYFFENQLSVGLGYAYREETTEGRNYAVHSNDVTFEFTAALPWELRLRGSVLYQDEDYLRYVRDPKRLDDIWTYRLALSRPIAKGVEVELGATYITADSTTDQSTYDRSIVGITASVAW